MNYRVMFGSAGRCGIALLLACFALLHGRVANATEVIKVVAIDGYPAGALWVREFSRMFIPEVDRRLAETGNYRIEWQESYGGTIVKPSSVLEGVRFGLGDIGIITTILYPSQLPSQSMATVTPFITDDAAVVARAVDEIARDFPSVQREFARHNQVYLATGVVLDTYQIFSRTRLDTFEDLEGAKVAGAGLNLRYLEGIPRAVGVRGGLTEFYNMLQTGLVSQAMLWLESAATFKIAEVAPFMLEADFGAVNTKAVTVNRDFWNGLPPEVRTVIQEVAIQYRDHLAKVATTRAIDARAAYIAGGGTIVPMSLADRKAWAERMPNLAREWAQTLDRKGEPGSEMLEAYIGRLAKDGYIGVRDWAAE